MSKNFKSIGHIASRSINIGDGAVHYVLDDVLFSNQNFNVTKIDSLDYRGLKESELDEDFFNNYDLTVIGGGGMIDGGKSHTKSGIAFPVSPEDVVSTKNKFAIVGIGHNLFQNQEFHNKNALINLIKSFEKRQFPFYVRNDGSLLRLKEELNDELSNVEEILDPGFFIGKNLKNTKSDKKVTIGIQLANDNLDKRLAYKNNSFSKFSYKKNNENTFIDIVSNLIEKINTQLDCNFLFLPHISKDIELSGKVINSLNNETARKKAFISRTYHPDNVLSFFQQYKECNFNIVMRGHGAICSTGMEIPTLALSTHNKVEGFMNEMDLNDYSLRLNNFDINYVSDFVLQNINSDELFSNQLKNKKQILEQDFFDKINKVKNLIEDSK